jgi:hypothetical protein
MPQYADYNDRTLFGLMIAEEPTVVFSFPPHI